MAVVAIRRKKLKQHDAVCGSARKKACHLQQDFWDGVVCIGFDLGLLWYF